MSKYSFKTWFCGFLAKVLNEKQTKKVTRLQNLQILCKLGFHSVAGLATFGM